ncbi:Jag N-terminal domain-containing protein [Candidatus Babeliales bacterium]|nr:Jag N-terminal domain-containing protein [Candidatus Babeliales bacterium]
MKNLVDEASSIFKAIEKAWTRAGKPRSFSVKVYEEPQSGFLGFNTKPAKVGIFYDEREVQNTPHKQQARPVKDGNRPQHVKNPAGQSQHPRRTDDHKESSNNSHNRSDNRQERTTPRHNNNNRPEHTEQRPQHHTRPVKIETPGHVEKKEHSVRQPRSENHHPRTQNTHTKNDDKRTPHNRNNERPEQRETRAHNEHRPVERKVAPLVQQPTEAPRSVPAAPRIETPVQQQSVEVSKPAVRKVLRVSGRRYIGPKKDTN